MGDEREYAGLFGRLKYVFTFYSLVDLAAIAPWYVDLFMGADNLSSTTFLRALRLRSVTVDGARNWGEEE